MGVYTRPDSPFFWLLLERPGQPALRERTRITHDAPTQAQRKDLRVVAEQRYHERMAALARADYQLPGHRATSTFDAFADWYTTHVSSHKKGKVREGYALAQLRAWFGPRDLAAITRDDVLEWRTARIAQVSRSTADRELSILKHVLASAVPTYLDASPIARLPRLKWAAPRVRTLTPAQEKRLLLQLTDEDRAIVVMAMDTLMRLSDIVNFRREDDRKRYLVVHDPKVDSYEVPVSKRLRAALDALPKAGPFYFPHRRTTDDPAQWRNAVKQALRRACKRARVPYGRGKGVTFHSLRHTGASRMVEAGVDVRTVQEIGGWKNLRQLSRYTHPTDKAKRKAVEVVGG